MRNCRGSTPPRKICRAYLQRQQTIPLHLRTCLALFAICPVDSIRVPLQLRTGYCVQDPHQQICMVPPAELTTMSWSDLPQELEEKIFSQLSLVELKGLISTRKLCLALFCKQLAIEQQALCDIAVSRYGDSRIKVFSDVCICLLAEGFVNEDLAMRMRQLPRDLHRDRRCKGRDFLFIFIHTYDALHPKFRHRYSCGYMEGWADLGWVAFLQAVLSVGGSALSHRVQVICNSLLFSDPLTLAGVKDHIVPLLPLVAGFTFWDGGRGISLKDGMHAGNLGPDENKRITLQLVFK